MFKALKVPVSQQTLDKLISEADVNANGEIEFDEFLMLCGNLKDSDNTAWAQLLKGELLPLGPVFFFPSAHPSPFSFSATNPNRLQKAQNIASDLLGIKGEADKRDIARYQKTSAFSTSAQAPKDDVSPPSLLSSLKICESDSWKHILILRPLSSIGARQLRGSRGSRKWWGRLKILR